MVGFDCILSSRHSSTELPNESYDELPNESYDESRLKELWRNGREETVSHYFLPRHRCIFCILVIVVSDGGLFND